MNICFDSTAFITAKNRGIGNYTISQLEEILKLDKTNNYFILNFFNNDLILPFDGKYENLKIINIPFGKHNGSTSLYDYILNIYPDLFGDIIQKFIQEYKIDVFYLTSFLWTNIKYKKEWFLGIKVYATLYDVIPYIFKKQYLRNKNNRKAYLDSLKSSTFFDGFAAISKSAKEDFVKITHYDPNKIKVIGGAPSDIFKKIKISKEEETEVRKKFNITRKFVICTGGDDYRKNIEKLIIAFSKIDEKYLKEYQLVVVCKLREDRVKYFNCLAETYNIKDNLVLTNFVSDKDLIALMNLASASAFPSMYEGFGLPVVEAYACQIPNLTSNNSSLGEIAKDSSILVDPFSIKSISNGLNELLNENNWSNLIEKGNEKLEIYNKVNVAKLTLDLIRQKPDNIDKKQIRKIAIFTPLPPLKSGISDYSYDVINKLSDFVDIDIYIDNGYKPIQFNKNNVRIFNYKYFRNNKTKYDKVIYEVGNSTYHTYMFKIMEKNKGIVELHDGNYRTLINHLCFNPKRNLSKKDYYNIAKYDLNELDYKKLVNESSAIFTPETIGDFPIRNFLLNNAESVIIHSDFLKKEVLHNYLIKSITIPLYTIQRQFDKNSLRKELNIKNDIFVISSFGIIHKNKRSFELLQAFRNLHAKNKNTVLYFVGECIDKDYKEKIESYIRNNNLMDCVFTLGFVDIDTFDKYIASSDIVVNLRYPYNGESSGSLSRSLGLGIPTMVNNVGSFGEFPDDVVIKLPDVLKIENEVNTIYETLNKYYLDNSLLNNMHENIIKYVKNNIDLTKICENYLNFLNNDRKINITSDIFKNLIKYQFVENKYSSEDINKSLTTLAYILSFND